MKAELRTVSPGTVSPGTAPFYTHDLTSLGLGYLNMDG